MKNAFDWYRNHWYYVGGVLFVILAIWMALFGELVDPVRRIMIVGFMGLLIHQFEEYVLPGGFPIVWNIVQSGETERYDRYPMNKHTSFICNVCLMYPLYILGIIFSRYYVLGLMLMFFSIGQVVIHGIILNIKMHRLYNPGVATMLFILIPVGIYYIWYVSAHFALPWWYYVLALILLMPVSFCSLMLPIKKLANKDTPHVWPQDEAEKFHVAKKMQKINPDLFQK